MWYNKIMIGLLESPLHSFLSKNMLVITYTGRKSGKAFSLPVNYLLDDGLEGGLLYTASQKDRVWWRNLRAGKPISLRLRGQDVKAIPTVIEDQAGVRQLFERYFELSPGLARYFQVELDEQGKASAADLDACARDRVMITFKVE